MLGARFERGGDLEEVAGADEVLHGVGGDENLTFGHADVELGPEAEALGDDGEDTIGELGGDAALDFGREGGHDPLQRFGAGRGMDGGHDEVAGLRGAQGQAHGFGVAHLAYHQHVGIFAERVKERLLEARRVASDFALADIGAAGAEGVFDGALDGDDVTGLGLVDLLDQRGEGRGFAGAGGAADEDQAVTGGDELLEVGVEIELFEVGGEGGAGRRMAKPTPREVCRMLRRQRTPWKLREQS